MHGLLDDCQDSDEYLSHVPATLAYTLDLADKARKTELEIMTRTVRDEGTIIRGNLPWRWLTLPKPCMQWQYAMLTRYLEQDEPSEGI